MYMLDQTKVTPDFLADFHARVRKTTDFLCERDGTSRKQISLALGKSRSFLDVSEKNISDVGFSVVASLAALSSTPLDWFAGRDNALSGPLQQQADRMAQLASYAARDAALEAGSAPIFEDILRIGYECDEDFRELGALTEYVDVYRAPKPEDQSLTVFSIGSKSLSAKVLGIHEPESMQYVLDRLDDAKVTDKLMRSYKYAASCGEMLSTESLNVRASGHKHRVRLDYMRLLKRFNHPDIGPVIVTYAKALR